MLHVVDVLSGTKLTLDAGFVSESADHVKQEIERRHGTRSVYQLLLTSDGDELKTDDRVNGDTVYLVDLTPEKSEKEARMDESDMIPEASVQGGGHAVLLERAQESRRLYARALEIQIDCEVRYQQRGYDVIVAHLEKVMSECMNNSEELKKLLKEYVPDKRMFTDDIMPDLEEELQVLSVMPMLDEDTTLLEWLKKEVFEGDVDGAAFQFYICLEKVGKSSTEELCTQLKKMIRDVNDRGLKILPKVGDGFEEMMRQMRNFVVDQSEIAQYFAKEMRQLAGSYEDEKVFKILDRMHHFKIQSARTNHRIIVRFHKAAKSMKMGVRQRLRDVLEARESLLEANLKIVARTDMLESLRYEIEMFRQVRNMSELYVEMVLEMVHGRSFVKEFMEKIEGHLLATLVSRFEGLEVEHLERVVKAYDGREDEEVPTIVRRAREMVDFIRVSEGLRVV